jgi:hypothetical protein
MIETVSRDSSEKQLYARDKRSKRRMKRQAKYPQEDKKSNNLETIDEFSSPNTNHIGSSRRLNSLDRRQIRQIRKQADGFCKRSVQNDQMRGLNAISPH